MQLSARNKIAGTVKAVHLGEVMAEVTIGVGENEVIAIITKNSVEQLNLKVGDQAFAVIKATEVMVAK